MTVGELRVALARIDSTAEVFMVDGMPLVCILIIEGVEGKPAHVYLSDANDNPAEW